MSTSRGEDVAAVSGLARHASWKGWATGKVSPCFIRSESEPMALKLMQNPHSRGILSAYSPFFV